MISPSVREIEERAAMLDAADALAAFRQEFHIPRGTSGRDVAYFCGNSLGLMPKAAQAAVEEVLTDWRDLAVRAHFEAQHPWMPYHEEATGSLARVVGALPVEVVAMNSLTTNLHLLMTSFYRPDGRRRKVLIEGDAFPSDRYAVASQVTMRGGDPERDIIRVAPRPGEATIRDDDLFAAIVAAGNELALVMLSGVHYLTGQAFPMAAVVSEAHRAGAVAGFDLAHAAGNLDLRLHDWDVDFAVWCNYKYLNAGPGAIGGAFVHERHSHAEMPRFAGWWGHDKATRFQMPDRFDPLAGAEGWQLSNPPILMLAALRASLDLFDRAGMERIRTKSVALTRELEVLLEKSGIRALSVITPHEPERRGAQLSLRLPGGRDVFERLAAADIICDWREPDIIRVAPVPLYNSFADVHRFVDQLRAAVR